MPALRTIRRRLCLVTTGLAGAIALHVTARGATPTSSPEIPPPEPIAFRLKSAQPELVANQKPRCLRFAPSGEFLEATLPKKQTFDRNGECVLPLDAGFYRFEVLLADPEANRIVVIRSDRIEVSTDHATGTLPRADKFAVRAWLDGTSLKLNQIAIRSIAPTGETRWMRTAAEKPSPELFAGGTEPPQVCLVGETSRASVAVWRRVAPEALANFHLRSTEENVVRFEIAPGSPPIKSARGWLIFPDGQMSFPVRPDHSVVVGRGHARLTYELISAGDRKLVVSNYDTPLAKQITLRLGGRLQASGWAAPIWQDNNRHYLQWQVGLIDGDGREVDRKRSKLAFESSISLSDGKPVPKNPLSKDFLKALSHSPDLLLCRASWSWAEPEKFAGAPERFIEQRSAHFRLRAPKLWAGRAAIYLQQLEGTFAALQKVTGRAGPERINLQWRNNTHNAKAQVGGKDSWMSMPFEGLRQAVNPFRNPWFMTHEMAHTFGYHHGKEMDGRVNAADREIERRRWRFVDEAAK